MKAKIEKYMLLEKRGIYVTSETEEEKRLLESLWTGSAAAVVFTRNRDGSVTLTIAPTKEENEDAGEDQAPAPS